MMKLALKRTRRIRGIVAGTVMEDGRVDFPGNLSEDPVPAKSVVPGIRSHAGREAVLMFEGGDPRKPVILGVVQPEVEVDGERLELGANREVTIRCGKASLTLTRAGKVLLRGAYVSSRSSGVNKIQGGSVQIN